MIESTKTLYQILSGQPSNIKLKPDVFVNDYKYENGALIFNSSGLFTKTFVRDFKIYIPFSHTGDLISDYNNGIYTVYPLYNILVIKAAVLNDPKTYSIAAVYPMNTVQFEEVYLDDNLDEVPINKVADTAAIKRYMPKSIAPMPNMTNFYNEVVNGIIKIQKTM